MTEDEDDDFDSQAAKEFAKNRREWIRHVMANGDILPTYRLIGVAVALRINHRTEKVGPLRNALPKTRLRACGRSSARSSFSRLKIIIGYPQKKRGQPIRDALPMEIKCQYAGTYQKCHSYGIQKREVLKLEGFSL
jgi:hypothetical protein